MPTRLAPAVVPALALALVLPLAGCSDGGDRPRLVVGDGPPADEWGLIGLDEGGQGEAPPARPPPARPTTAPEPDRRGDDDPDGEREDRDEDDEGDGGDGGDGDGQPAARGPLLVLEPGGAPGAFVVTGHADGADWGDVAAAADAGSWTLVVEGGSSGEYDLGDGLVASPDPGPVRDGDVLRFCDRSAVDGVTASYVQVQDVPTGEVLLRERVQGSPC